MPTLDIEGFTRCEAPQGTRLVLAIESCGVDIGHRCGGKARCTTCRVRVLEGEPQTMTRAEYDKLSAQNLLGEVRLSCQIVVQGPMRVEPLMRVSEKGWTDPGPAPAPDVEPEAAWFPIDALRQEGGDEA